MCWRVGWCDLYRKKRAVLSSLHIRLTASDHALMMFCIVFAPCTAQGRMLQNEHSRLHRLAFVSQVLLFNKSHGCPDGSAVPDGAGGVHIVFDWSTGLGAPGSDPDNGLGSVAFPVVVVVVCTSVWLSFGCRSTSPRLSCGVCVSA